MYCSVSLCYVTLRYVVLCYAVLCYVMLCDVLLFNRYRAFRRASDMRCVLYVICCWLCILGKVDAIWGVYFEHFGVTWVYLGAILGNVGPILGPLWEVLGVLGSTLEGFRVQGLSFGVWALIITTHTSLKCQNRSRSTHVQRKLSSKKRRCYQTLKYHTL